MPVIGFLSAASPADRGAPGARVPQRPAAKAGYVEGQNVAIEYHWAEGQYDRLPRSGGRSGSPSGGSDRSRPAAASALAAKAATTTIPIVFAAATIRSGRPRRQPQPAGRQRHRHQLSAAELGAKRLELLHELLPRADSRCRARRSATGPAPRPVARRPSCGSGHRASRSTSSTPSTDRDIDAAFASLVRKRADGALGRRRARSSTTDAIQIVALAARHGCPRSTPCANTPQPAA